MEVTLAFLAVTVVGAIIIALFALPKPHGGQDPAPQHSPTEQQVG